MPPILHDAVTLLHFGAGNALDVLRKTDGHRPEPRWSEEVHSEISAGAGFDPAAAAVVAEDWLGDPASPMAADLAAINRLQIGLNEGVEPATQHLGEAQSIYFAEQQNGTVATDDNGAFEFALNRLGEGRVVDTIWILRQAVANGDITPTKAAEIADAIETAGRSFRPAYRVARAAEYFDQ